MFQQMNCINMLFIDKPDDVFFFLNLYSGISYRRMKTCASLEEIKLLPEYY